MPQRKIGRELGCDEKTVRTDLKRLRLAAEQSGASSPDNVTAPPFVELTKAVKPESEPSENIVVQAGPTKPQPRHCVTELEQKRNISETEQDVPEELPTHIESNALATAILNWSLTKPLTVRDEFAIFKAVEPFILETGHREGAACEDPEAVFESIERDRPVPTQEPQALMSYAEVLAEALPKLAPEPKIRYWAIQKAIAEVVMFIRYPGELERGML